MYALCLWTALLKGLSQCCLLAGLLLCHPTQLFCSSHHWYVKLLFPKCESVKIGRLIYFGACVSDTIFKKYIMATCTSHKIPSLGHANKTLKRSECSVPLHMFHQEHLSAIVGSHHIFNNIRKIQTFFWEMDPTGGNKNIIKISPFWVWIAKFYSFFLPYHTSKKKKIGRDSCIKSYFLHQQYAEF